MGLARVLRDPEVCEHYRPIYENASFERWRTVCRNRKPLGALAWG
jgi:hypothetical protein